MPYLFKLYTFWCISPDTRVLDWMKRNRKLGLYRPRGDISVSSRSHLKFKNRQSQNIPALIKTSFWNNDRTTNKWYKAIPYMFEYFYSLLKIDKMIIQKRTKTVICI